MKQKLLYLVTVLCALAIFTACSDDDPKPPTPEDIAATYSADKLKATVNGETCNDNAKVQIIKGSTSSTVDLKLFNMIEGQEEFTIPNVQFQALTKSDYYSQLNGETTNNLLGIKASVTGSIEAEILSLTITSETFEGDTIANAEELWGTYKGEMLTTITGYTKPQPVEQRIYLMKARKNETSSVKLQIKNFALNEDETSYINLDTLTVTQRGDVYAFKGEERKVSVRYDGKSVSTMARLEGTIQNGNMLLKLNLAADALSADVDFKGSYADESTLAEVTRFEFENGGAIADTLVKGKSYSIYFWDNTPAEKLLITPKLTLSKGASYTSVIAYYEGANHDIQANEAVDFSKFKDGDYIKYSLQAEDPSYTADYFIYVRHLTAIANSKYDFVNWKNNGSFEEPEGWATSNGAASMLKLFGYYPAELAYPVSKTDENSAKVITVDTKGGDMSIAIVPAITAGTLFTGKFEVSLENTLKSTHFGIPYNLKPTAFKGEYRYTPGATYYKTVIDASSSPKNVYKEEVPGQVDECSINAILYEVDSYQETLDGTNINSSDKIVAVALLPDGSAKAENNTFEVDFTYTKQYDASKKYKLAIVCSSSAKGDSFEGAPGSELIIRNLEVVNE